MKNNTKKIDDKFSSPHLSPVDTESPTQQKALLGIKSGFEAISDTVPVLLWLTGPDAACTYVNQTWTQYSGRSLEDELGNGWQTLLHADDVHYYVNTYMNAFNKRRTFKLEARLRRADGIYHWFVVTGAPKYNPDSSFAGYIGSCIDITEHKNAELVLWESKELYRSFFENTVDGILLTGLDGTVIAANPAACRLLGRPESELIKLGLSIFDDEHLNWEALINEGCSRGKAQGQTWVKHKTGTKIFVEVSTNLFNDRNGIPKNLVVIRNMTRHIQMKEELEKYRHHLEDLVQEYLKELKQVNFQLEQEIAERKQAEAELQASNQQIASILESITDGFFAVDHNWHLTYLNKEAERLWNRSRREVIGQYLWDVFPEAVGSNFYSKNLQALKEQVAIHYEEYFHPFEKWLEVHAYPSSHGLSVYFRDVTERKVAEEDLRKSEQKFKTLVENLPDVVTRFDKETRFVYVNPAIQFYTGETPHQLIGKSLYDTKMGEFWLPHVKKAFETKSKVTVDFEKAEFHGHRYYQSFIVPEFEADGSVDYVLRITRDITERKQFEKELARLDRLNMVGEMAASIGHEVRNPMTTVRGFLQMLQNKQEFTHHHEYFDIMINELDRANAIITEFLSLAKNKTVKLSPQNLNSIIDSLYPLIRADGIVTNKYILLELSAIPNVWADEKEIRQLLLNLTRNGLEAMKPGGNLTIKTYIHDGDVVLAVQDQGTGIPPDLMDKIGTPFFTTKEEGSGLGLAVCYSIAARHKAAIKFDTGTDGTTFFVRFKPVK